MNTGLFGYFELPATGYGIVDTFDKHGYLFNENTETKDLSVKDILNFEENLHDYIRKKKKHSISCVAGS